MSLWTSIRSLRPVRRQSWRLFGGSLFSSSLFSGFFRDLWLTAGLDGDQNRLWINQDAELFGQVQVRNPNRIIDVEFGHIDLDRRGQVAGQTFDSDFTDHGLERPAGGDAFGSANDADGDGGLEWLALIDFKEVGVQERAGHRVTLHLFEQHQLVVHFRRRGGQFEQGRPLDLQQLEAKLLGIDAERGRRSPGAIKDGRHFSSPAASGRRALFLWSDAFQPATVRFPSCPHFLRPSPTRGM